MLPKDKGGLGLINIDIKSKCILANTFMKAFVNPEQITFMMEYYNTIRIGQLFNNPMCINNVSFTGTAYYNQIVETVRKCLHVPKFPYINSKMMYFHLLPIEKPKIEYMYDNSLFKWSSIWKNIAFKYIHVKERELLFKYIHEILPTKKRLAMIPGSNNSSKCSFCDLEESNIHFTYQCTYYKPVFEWFKRLLDKCCNINTSMIKILMFDISNVNRLERNTCIVLVATYIANIWIARKLELTPSVAITFIKGKILFNKLLNKYRLKTKINLIFTDMYLTLKYTNI